MTDQDKQCRCSFCGRSDGTHSPDGCPAYQKPCTSCDALVKAAWTEGYMKAQNTIMRRNKSGCCCKWSEDEREIVSLCNAHKEKFETMTDKTTNVINFPKCADKNAPDSDQAYVDEKGVTWFKYTCGYKSCETISGVDYSTYFAFDIWATSQEDAERRLIDIKETGEIQGQVFAEVDA